MTYSVAGCVEQVEAAVAEVVEGVALTEDEV